MGKNNKYKEKLTITLANFGTTILLETDADDENWKIFALIAFNNCWTAVGDLKILIR